MWPDILGFRDPDWQNGLEVWQLDCACFNCHLNSLSKNDGKSQIDINNSVFHFCFLNAIGGYRKTASVPVIDIEHGNNFNFPVAYPILSTESNEEII